MDGPCWHVERIAQGAPALPGISKGLKNLPLGRADSHAVIAAIGNKKAVVGGDPDFVRQGEEGSHPTKSRSGHPDQTPRLPVRVRGRQRRRGPLNQRRCRSSPPWNARLPRMPPSFYPLVLVWRRSYNHDFSPTVEVREPSNDRGIRARQGPVRKKSTNQRVDSRCSFSKLGIAIVKEKRMRLPDVFAILVLINAGAWAGEVDTSMTHVQPHSPDLPGSLSRTMMDAFLPSWKGLGRAWLWFWKDGVEIVWEETVASAAASLDGFLFFVAGEEDRRIFRLSVEGGTAAVDELDVEAIDVSADFGGSLTGKGKVARSADGAIRVEGCPNLRRADGTFEPDPTAVGDGPFVPLTRDLHGNSWSLTSNGKLDTRVSVLAADNPTAGRMSLRLKEGHGSLSWPMLSASCGLQGRAAFGVSTRAQMRAGWSCRQR